jgi:hypothetical protein
VEATIAPKGLLLWVSAVIYSKISIENITSIDSQTKEKISLAPTPFSDETSLLYNLCIMTRLSLKVVYLWRHVSSTAPPFILWWWNLEILFAPLNRSSPLIGENCAVKQFKWNTLLYSREDPKRSLYCEVSVTKTEPVFNHRLVTLYYTPHLSLVNEYYTKWESYYHTVCAVTKRKFQIPKYRILSAPSKTNWTSVIYFYSV